MAKHVRTTITVPPELKARMDTVEEEVNWSAVAAQAFEQRLAQIIQQKGPANVDEVIKRLRASKKRIANKRYHQGNQDGAQWARTSAEVDELERLESSASGWSDYFFREYPQQGNVVAHAVTEQVLGDKCEGDWALVKEYTERIFGSKHPDPEYVRGFVKGAVEVWRSVEDRVLNDDEEQDEAEDDAPPELSTSTLINLRRRLRSTIKPSTDSNPPVK
jgi:hypothetical protein